MGRKKANKQVAFYEHKHTEHSTTRRYHANILQQRRTIQLEVDTVLHAADLDDDPPLRVLGPSENLFDDIPPEVIEHQLTGVRVVARSEGPDRKRYESTVSICFLESPLCSQYIHRWPLCFPLNHIGRNISTRRSDLKVDEDSPAHHVRVVAPPCRSIVVKTAPRAKSSVFVAYSRVIEGCLFTQSR